MAVIDRIVSRVGRRVDESSPMVDARLPDGSRINAVIPPLAIDGPVLSIRRFGASITAEQLVGFGALTEQMLFVLASCVRRGSTCSSRAARARGRRRCSTRSARSSPTTSAS
jgi:pilus assembly protein CpaF